jgi:type I site-specific restriction endonuclease
MNKKALSERDICTKFITPALVSAQWDLMSQIREEVSFTKGRVIVRGQLSTRGEAKRADYLLYLKPGIPLAVGEAIRKHDVKTPADEQRLQDSIRGVEKKPMPHLLCVTNMLLHQVEVPVNIRHDNTLSKP